MDEHRIGIDDDISSEEFPAAATTPAVALLNL